MYSVDPKVYELHKKTGGDSKKLKEVRGLINRVTNTQRACFYC